MSRNVTKLMFIAILAIVALLAFAMFSDAIIDTSSEEFDLTIDGSRFSKNNLIRKSSQIIPGVFEMETTTKSTVKEPETEAPTEDLIKPGVIEPSNTPTPPAGTEGMIKELSGDALKKQLWYDLRKEGYSEYAVAGVLGNIGQECGFRTYVIQNHYKDVETYYLTYDFENKIYDSVGTGMAQWTYYSRKELLWNTSQGMFPGDKLAWSYYSVQLAVLKTEMIQYSLNPEQLNQAGENAIAQGEWQAIYDSMYLFERRYERAGKPNYTRRMEYAMECYNKFKGMVIE